MFNDSGAHKEFCGPGEPPSNSTLAPTGNGPACAPVGSSGSIFATFRTASLDDSISRSDFERHLSGIRLTVSMRDPCNPCASLDRPVFSSFDTASLDDHTMPTDFARHFSGKRVAIYCCNYTSLPRAVFSPFETASLDPLLTVPQGLANHGVMRLAVC